MSQNSRKQKRSRTSLCPYSASEQDTAPDLPGFYYDPVKQKYFKIESNSYSVQSVITKHSVAKSTKPKAVRSPAMNLLNSLISTEINGFRNKLDYNDFSWTVTTPVKIFDLSTYPRFKQIQLFEMNAKLYILVNFLDDLFSYNCCMLKLNRRDLDLKMQNIIKEVDFSFVKFRNLSTNRNELSLLYEQYSSTKSYIQNGKYYVKTHNQEKPSSLYISLLSPCSDGGLENCLDNYPLASRSYKTSAIWCSTRNLIYSNFQTI